MTRSGEGVGGGKVIPCAEERDDLGSIARRVNLLGFRSIVLCKRKNGVICW